MRLIKKLKEDVNKTVAIASLVGVLSSGIYTGVQDFQAHELRNPNEKNIQDKDEMFIQSFYSPEQKQEIEKKLANRNYGLIGVFAFFVSYSYAVISHFNKSKVKDDITDRI